MRVVFSIPEAEDARNPLKFGSRAASLKLMSSLFSNEDENSDDETVIASCEACLGRGELLLPRVARITESNGVNATTGIDLAALDVEAARSAGLMLAIRGEMPVASIHIGGAKAFVQVGDNPAHRVWA